MNEREEPLKTSWQVIGEHLEKATVGNEMYIAHDSGQYRITKIECYRTNPNRDPRDGTYSTIEKICHGDLQLRFED